MIPLLPAKRLQNLELALLAPNVETQDSALPLFCLLTSASMELAKPPQENLTELPAPTISIVPIWTVMVLVTALELPSEEAALLRSIVMLKLTAKEIPALLKSHPTVTALLPPLPMNLPTFAAEELHVLLESVLLSSLEE